MSKITSILDIKKTNQVHNISPDEQIEELSKSFKKNASSTSRSDKKNNLLKEIKNILKKKNILFRASPPKDWEVKKRLLAIFFPEKKIFFMLEENEHCCCRDDWSCYKIDENDGADFSALKIINSIGDLYNGRAEEQASIKPDKPRLRASKKSL
ncbi:hypothetical protein ACUNEV_26580 [Serratia sp. IR-2025]